jgi:hypothetical protein
VTRCSLTVRVKLHTELLAEKRKQQREEKEMAQLRHAQLKILGKKTLEDFAQLKLIRRETAATRGRSLHCNGTSSKSSRSAFWLALTRWIAGLTMMFMVCNGIASRGQGVCSPCSQRSCT